MAFKLTELFVEIRGDDRHLELVKSRQHASLQQETAAYDSHQRNLTQRLAAHVAQREATRNQIADRFRQQRHRVEQDSEWQNISTITTQRARAGAALGGGGFGGGPAEGYAYTAYERGGRGGVRAARGLGDGGFGGGPAEGYADSPWMAENAYTAHERGGRASSTLRAWAGRGGVRAARGLGGGIEVAAVLVGIKLAMEGVNMVQDRWMMGLQKSTGQLGEVAATSLKWKETLAGIPIIGEYINTLLGVYWARQQQIVEDFKRMKELGDVATAYSKQSVQGQLGFGKTSYEQERIAARAEWKEQNAKAADLSAKAAQYRGSAEGDIYAAQARIMNLQATQNLANKMIEIAQKEQWNKKEQQFRTDSVTLQGMEEGRAKDIAALRRRHAFEEAEAHRPGSTTDVGMLHDRQRAEEFELDAKWRHKEKEQVRVHWREMGNLQIAATQLGRTAQYNKIALERSDALQEIDNSRRDAQQRAKDKINIEEKTLAQVAVLRKQWAEEDRSTMQRLIINEIQVRTHGFMRQRELWAEGYRQQLDNAQREGRDVALVHRDFASRKQDVEQNMQKTAIKDAEGMWSELYTFAYGKMATQRMQIESWRQTTLAQYEGQPGMQHLITQTANLRMRQLQQPAISGAAEYIRNFQLAALARPADTDVAKELREGWLKQIAQWLVKTKIDLGVTD